MCKSRKEKISLLFNDDSVMINRVGLIIRLREMLNDGMQNQRCLGLKPCFADDIITGLTMMAVSAKLRWNVELGDATNATHQHARNSDKWRKQSGIRDCWWSKVATASALQIVSPIIFATDCVDLQNILHPTFRVTLR